MGSAIDLYIGKLLLCSNLKDVLAVLASDPRWLREEERNSAWEYCCARPALAPAERFLVMVNEVAKSVECAVNASNTEELLNGIEDSETAIILTGDFFDFVQQLNSSGPLAGDLQSAFDALSALKSLLDAPAALQMLLSRGECDPESLEVALAIQRVSDPQTLRAVTLRAESPETDEDKSRRVLSWAEEMETAAYNRFSLESAVKSGKTRYYNRQLKSGQTDLWWVHSEIPSGPLMALQSTPPDGDTVAFDGMLEHVARDAAAQYKLARETCGVGDYLPSREAWILHKCAAFCVVSSVSSPPAQTRLAVQRFRELLTGPWAEGLAPEARLAWLFRFSRFYAQEAAVLVELRVGYQWIVDQLNHHMEQLNQDAPGLRRDVALHKARMLRELSRWEPELLSDSITSFRNGLNERWARHDREARGQGLGDLASALFQETGRVGSEKCRRLYEKALRYLPADEFPLGRVTVLLNYAIALTEARVGDSLANHEMALEHLDEAVELRAAKFDQFAQDDTSARHYFAGQLASLLMTRGNVVRARRFGAQGSHDEPSNKHDPRTDAALRDYRYALRLLGDIGHENLRGLLNLNIGYAMLDDFASPTASLEAEHALEQAEILLTDDPVQRAMAVLARVEAWISRSEGTPPRDEVRCALDRVLECESVLRAHGSEDGVAKAAMRRAQVRMMSGGNRAHLFDAADALEVCANAHRNQGSQRALRHALRLRAIVLMDLESGARGQVQRADLRQGALRCLREALTLGARSRDADLLLEELDESAEQAEIASDLLYLTVNGLDGHQLSKLVPAPHFRHLCRTAAAADVNERSLRFESGGEGGGPSSLMLERDLLNAGRRTAFHTSLRPSYERVVSAANDARRVAAIRMLDDEITEGASEPPAALESNEVEIQLAVSQWGGLGFVRHGASPLQVFFIPVSRSTLASWLFGDTGWFSLTSRRNDDQASRARWERRCEELLEALGRDVLEPIFASIGDTTAIDVRIVPGPFAALPIQAALVSGRSLLSVVNGFALVAEPGRTLLDVVAPMNGRALLVLSDPSSSGVPSLPGAAPEVEGVARLLGPVCASIDMLAVSGTSLGRAAFREDATFPDRSVIHSLRPTPRNIATQLGCCDLFVYVGHGNHDGLLGGQLALSDDLGRHDSLDLFGALASGGMRPGAGVVLAACGTAAEPGISSAGLMSMASTALRLGAGFVLGSLWAILDCDVPLVTTAFLDALLRGLSPEEAFVVAVNQLRETGVSATRWSSFVLWRGQRSNGFLLQKPLVIYSASRFG